MEKQENKLIVHGFGNMIVPINYPDTPGDLLIELKLKMQAHSMQLLMENDRKRGRCWCILLSVRKVCLQFGQ